MNTDLRTVFPQDTKTSTSERSNRKTIRIIVTAIVVLSSPQLSFAAQPIKLTPNTSATPNDSHISLPKATIQRGKARVISVANETSGQDDELDQSTPINDESHSCFAATLDQVSRESHGVAHQTFSELVGGSNTLRGLLVSSANGDNELDEQKDQDETEENKDSEEADRKPTVENGRFHLPTLEAVSLETAKIGNGMTPKGFRGNDETSMAPLPELASEREENWNWAMRTWAAPNTFSHPRYFEDRMLERHGHERFPHLTPVIAGMRFFATVPMLPYLATVRNPCECEYTLGYYRTGSCVPAFIQRPPYQRTAVAAQATAIATGIIALP